MVQMHETPAIAGSRGFELQHNTWDSNLDSSRPAPDPASWRAFLTAIHGTTRGYIELRFIREGRTNPLFVRTIDEACAAIADHANAWNVYCAMARRRLSQAEYGRGAGGKGNLSEVGALWFDWDPPAELSSEEQRGEREALEIALETMPPCGPHMLVWSGGGLHGYWLFDEPRDARTTEAQAELEATLRGIADYLGTDRAVTDASRIMRVPGTFNFPDQKKRAKGRTVAACVFHQVDNRGRP